MASINTQPIVSLTPFMGNKWWIKCRVTDKSPIRTWNKPTSQGKLFSCTLVDESGAIRATFFNQAVDNFFEQLTPQGVFYFSGGSCKAANKKFNNVANEYECSFDEKSSVQVCNDANTAAIPTQRYNFVPVHLLKSREAGSMADILCVITEIGEVGKITQKSSGNELTKRQVRVADSTAAVECTLWNDQALSWTIPVGTVVAMRGIKISNWDGVSISTTQGGAIDITPQVEETNKLAAWYAATNGTDVASLTVKGGNIGSGVESKGRKYFEDVEREGLGKGEKADFIEVRCITSFIRTENLFYEACPKCNKKLGGDASSGYRCEKCENNVEHSSTRYLTSLMVSDNVSQQWLTMFDDCGRTFFGMEAGKLKAKMDAEPAYIAKLAQELMHVPMIASIRVKEERYGDNPQDRMKMTLNKVNFFTKDSAKINNEIDQLLEHCQAYA